MFFIIVLEKNEKKQKKGERMKIQHLAVIFVLIMIPIVFVLSTYMGAQITAITIQANYDTKLYNATYDAVKAFQINTINNKFSTISDSKIRDIYASANTFYNSLSSNFKQEGFTVEDLYAFTPAMVYTLYDGYYIYGQYENTEKQNEKDIENYEYALKPMIYYSCRYVGTNNSYDIVVNYTLDNYITVMGKLGTETVTRSGYFINPEIISASSDTQLATKIKNAYKEYQDEKKDEAWDVQQEYQLRRENRIFDTKILSQFQYGNTPVNEMKVVLAAPNGEIVIRAENLKESLLFAEGTAAEEYQYVIYKGQKYYLENGNLVDEPSTRYFQYDTNYKKQYISPPSASDAKKDPMYWIWQYLEYCRVGNTLYSTTAMDYYLNAYIFSEWASSALKNVSVKNAKGIVLQKEGTEDNPSIKATYSDISDKFYTQLSGDDVYIFRANEDNNDPEAEASNFQEHRRNVIRNSIETNLKAAIANFNLYTTNAGYQYVLPVLNEEDWEKVTHNICVISFMQGMPVNGYKYYNNYCVITNNKNKEFIGKNGIYLASKTGNYANSKHSPGCMALMEEAQNDLGNIVGYNVTDFLRQNVKQDEENVNFFYQHYDTSCYECLIGTNSIYDIEEMFQGKIYKYEYGEKVKDGTDYEIEKTSNSDENFKAIRTAYMTALAREKHGIMKTMGYFGS